LAVFEQSGKEQAMATGLNVGGWIFLLASWGLIIGVTIWCFAKLLASNKSNQ
jgi:type IV secretory pathway TrbD component